MTLFPPDDEQPGTDPRQFDLAKSRAAREEAVARVDAHATPAWKDEALEGIRLVARRLPYFTSDDVWEEPGVTPTRENRALGPILRAAASRGWCERTDRTATTRQVKRHGTDVRIWRSLIYVAEV